MKKITLLMFAMFILGGTINAQTSLDLDKVKLSGIMFGDYFYNIDQKDNSKKNINGFQLRRIYITTDYAVSENFDSRFRLEAGQSGSLLTAGGKIGVMVKDAYLKWKGVFSGSDLVFGLSPTPAFSVSEGAWGYRALEKTIMDLNGIVSSRDLGVDLKGKLTNTGSINYWLKIGNNSGNAPETNKYKRFYSLLQFKPAAGFQFTVYGDYASKPNKIDAYDHQSKSNAQTVGALFLNYKGGDSYSLGLETFYRNIQNNVAGTAGLQNQNSFGVSAWAWFTLGEQLRLVGRFDSYDPNTDKNNDKSTLVLAGLDYRPSKNVSIIPNVESVSYQGVDTKDLVGKVTFYWQF